MLRFRALVKWRLILEKNLSVSTAGRQLTSLCESLQTESLISQTIMDLFVTKSTGTLCKRAESILALMKWQKIHGHAQLDVREHIVYEYVCYLRRSNVGCTTATQFKEALNFCAFTIGLDHAQEAATSGRVKGACADMFL